MKKIYPGLKMLLLSIIFYGLLYLLVWYLMFLGEYNTFLILIVIIPLTCMLTLYLVIFTTSIQIEQDFLLYKNTCFSKAKKVFFRDIKKLTFEYYRGQWVKIVYKDNQLTGTKNRSLSIPLNILLIQELLKRFPKELLSINCCSKTCIPKRHKKIFLEELLLKD